MSRSIFQSHKIKNSYILKKKNKFRSYVKMKMTRVTHSKTSGFLIIRSSEYVLLYSPVVKRETIIYNYKYYYCYILYFSGYRVILLDEIVKFRLVTFADIKFWRLSILFQHFQPDSIWKLNPNNKRPFCTLPIQQQYLWSIYNNILWNLLSSRHNDGLSPPMEMWKLIIPSNFKLPSSQYLSKIIHLYTYLFIYWQTVWVTGVVIIINE